MKPHKGIAELFRISAGLIAWASFFVMLYASLSLGCQVLEVPPEAALVNPVTGLLLAISLVHAGVLAGLLVWHYKRPIQVRSGEAERSAAFRRRVEGLVLWVSVAALVFVAFPVLMVPPCAP